MTATRTPLAALATVLLAQCAPRVIVQSCPTPRAPRAANVAANSASAEPVVPAPLLAQRVESIVRGAAPAGARFVRYVAAGFLTERQSVTHAIDVPPGTCVSIVSYASPAISDLDARAYDGDGELLVEDVEPDSHPTVQLCGDEARRVFHVVQAFEGEGAYTIALFSGERRAMEAIARVVGGRPGTAVSTRSEASTAERRASELRASLQRRGFAPVGDAARVSIAAASAVSIPLVVSADRCYTLAATADEEASVDLRVYDSDGELLAFDTLAERDAAVQLCPNASGPLRLEVRGASAGSAVIATYAADAASFGGSNTLWLGDRTSIAVSPMALDARVQSLRPRWSSAGYIGAASIAPVAFAASESRETALVLEPGRCTLIASVAGRGVGRTALSIFDEAGELLARGAWWDASATAVVCSAQRERVLARQRVEVGVGEVGLAVAPSSAVPSWANGVDRVLVSEALARPFSQESAWRPLAAPERIRVGNSAARAREFDLNAGTCTRIQVSVGRPLGPLSLTLRGATGAELTRSAGTGSARLTHCVVLPTHVRLEVELDPRESPERDAIWQRFERPDSDRLAEGATRP